MTCTFSAVKVNSILKGKLRSRLTSGISMRSFQNKCLGISQPIKYVYPGDQNMRCICSRVKKVAEAVITPHLTPVCMDMGALFVVLVLA
jgi:hypothetical protein